MIYGNISDFGGARAAGHVSEEYGQEGSPVAGLDKAGDVVTKDSERGILRVKKKKNNDLSMTMFINVQANKLSSCFFPPNS